MDADQLMPEELRVNLSERDFETGSRDGVMGKKMRSVSAKRKERSRSERYSLCYYKYPEGNEEAFGEWATE